MLCFRFVYCFFFFFCFTTVDDDLTGGTSKVSVISEATVGLSVAVILYCSLLSPSTQPSRLASETVLRERPFFVTLSNVSFLFVCLFVENRHCLQLRSGVRTLAILRPVSIPDTLVCSVCCGSAVTFLFVKSAARRRYRGLSTGRRLALFTTRHKALAYAPPSARVACQAGSSADAATVQ